MAHDPLAGDAENKARQPAAPNQERYRQLIKPLPSRDRILDLLDYNPATGIFRWKIWRSPRAVKGQIAGRISDDGHRYIVIDGQGYYAHRLAWKLVNGVDPDGRLDHRDNNPDHNMIKNLRPATHFQNMQNRKRHKQTKSGFKGVYQVGSRFMAIITVNHERHYLGCFPTAKKAHRKYCTAAKQYHGQFARTQ